MANNNNNNKGKNPYIDIIKTMNSTIDIRDTLDDILRESGFGSISSAASLNLYGLNFLRHHQPLVPSNRDNMGYVFFTRPILNLSYDNLSTSPTMIQLRDAPSNSIAGYVRSILDPWQAIRTHKGLKGVYNDPTKKHHAVNVNASFSDNVIEDFLSPLANPLNPFIPVLTNFITSLSGWKDITLNSYVSKAGINNEQWSMVDGFFYKNEAYEMTASFRNIDGDPISYLFQVWEEYMGACGYRWQMTPYPCFIEEREWDYNTCIYRFIMDETRTYIRKWATTIAAPLSVPYGAQFNYSNDKNFIDSNNEVTISFQCNGAQYNDPITFHNFNTLVAIYNSDLEITGFDNKTKSLVTKGSENGTWRKLTHDVKAKGLGFALPLINPVTQELEWWIQESFYEAYVKGKDFKGWKDWDAKQADPNKTVDKRGMSTDGKRRYKAQALQAQLNEKGLVDQAVPTLNNTLNNNPAKTSEQKPAAKNVLEYTDEEIERHARLNEMNEEDDYI